MFLITNTQETRNYTTLSFQRWRKAPSSNGLQFMEPEGTNTAVYHGKTNQRIFVVIPVYTGQMITLPWEIWNRTLK